jgi:hypothetical protein
MAIMACKECAREVSDKAVRCPYCGVPIAGEEQRKPRRVKSWFFGSLIIGLSAWGALTTLWLTGIVPVPKQLAGYIGTSSPLWTVKASSEETIKQVPVAVSAQSAPELKPVNNAVYRTSVDQLNQDYDANEVAVQGKIGDSPIRVSGTVAEINDVSGHPVVTLRTSSDNKADMLLTDDQRPAAAQLSKDDAVEIQCSKMQRIEARLHGGGCALVLVDSSAKLVYLAVSLSTKAGSAPLYIAGPMSPKTCLASGDTIAVQLTSNPKSDRVLSKSCAATARESISLQGCHLSSTMSAIPDIPSAHLWKYDCMAPAAETRTAETTTSRGSHKRAAATAAVVPAAATTVAVVPAAAATITALSQPIPASAAAASDSDAPTLTAPQEAASGSAAAVKPPEPAPITTSAEGPPAAKVANNPGSTGGAAPATVAASGADSSQQPTPAAEPGSSSTAPTPSTAAADDLVPVRTKDPQAADRIVSYCSKITSGATNPATVAARCRRDEMDAWTRLMVQNEFPTLDETSRRKCNEPPFPDSFVARESCAKYQLHRD